VSGSALPQAGALPLEELERVLVRACGVALSPGVRQTLADGFLRAARESGAGPEVFLRRVLAGQARAVALLVEHAVVGETYFFRHPEQLAALSHQLLAQRPLDRPLRAWSAGCATGEEPYTLAMMLLEAGRAAAEDQILGSDVSSRALEAARAGHYGEWSLRQLAPELRTRFFVPAGRRLAVVPEVRRRVEFRRHNLVRDRPPLGGFDLILCRNVLVYFTAQTAAAVLTRLADALRPGGWLLVGPLEVALAAPGALDRLEVQGATLLRRPEGARRGAARPAPARRTTSPQPGTTRPSATASRPSGPAQPAAGETPPRPVVPLEGAVHLGAFREAALGGDGETLARLARQAGAALCPECFLLLAMVSEAQGDDAGALESVRRALYLQPDLAQAHAALVPLFQRLGQPGEAERARRNALVALDGVDDAVPLPGVEPITAGALRQALGQGAPSPAPRARPREQP
jgi:chemotaxis protein methyltransferase CheR